MTQVARNLTDTESGFLRGPRCLNRMIFFGQDSLRQAVGEFMAHYHAERNHQGLENRLVRPAPVTTPSQPLHRRQRLGGMLNYYHRAAA